MQELITRTPEGLSLADFIKVIRKRKAFIILIFCLVVITAVMVTSVVPKSYLAEVTIRVEKPEGEVAVWQAQSTGNYDPYFIKEQFEILQSKKILRTVIYNLSLVRQLNSIYNAAFTEEEIYVFLSKNLLRVESRTGTSLIDIGVLIRENPVLAATIANEIASVYAEDRKSFAVSGQTEGIKKLNEELVRQEDTVFTERDVVEKLRQDLEIAGVDINTAFSQLEIENLRDIERNLTSLRVDAIARKTRWERFKSIPVEERFNLVNSEMIPDANAQGLLQALLVSEQQYVRLKGRMGENHPDLVSTRAGLEKIREQLANVLRGFEKSLEITYLEAQARVEALEGQLNKARVDQIKSASEKMRLFEEAVQKLRDEENLQKAFRIALRQREIDYQVPKRTIEVLNEAVPPERAAKPNWFLNIGLAIILGSILGMGSAFIIEFLDTSFKSVEDLERKLQLPILGVVSRNLVLVDTNNFNSIEAEPYRVIQTNLELASGEIKGKVIVVQSAGPGEGKSTTLYNLGAVMAMAGQRVLVIDTDLRRPSQHRLFETDRKPGIIEYMQGKQDFSSLIRKSKVENMDFLPSGDSTGFHLSVLHVKPLTDLLELLGQTYDKILLDSPPIIGISDASILASRADGVVFVVQHGRNPQSMTARARQIVQNVEGRILGVVLNRVPDGGDEDYNYYTSNYYYYGQKSDEKARRSSPRPVDPQDNEGLDEIEFEEELDSPSRV